MAAITTELEEQKRDRQGRRITRAARRVDLVDGYRASGRTMEQFARQEGINRPTLANWCNLHGRSKQPKLTSFAEVKLGPLVAAAWAFELTLPNGWVVSGGCVGVGATARRGVQLKTAMFNFAATQRIYLAVEPVDMRKQFNQRAAVRGDR
ncbi:MAG: hypothetical protein WC205_09760 [Opitutaceae bacterium]|jgi:transposase-like protein